MKEFKDKKTQRTDLVQFNLSLTALLWGSVEKVSR